MYDTMGITKYDEGSGPTVSAWPLYLGQVSVDL